MTLNAYTNHHRGMTDHGNSCKCDNSIYDRLISEVIVYLFLLFRFESTFCCSLSRTSLHRLRLEAKNRLKLPYSCQRPKRRLRNTREQNSSDTYRLPAY